MNYLLDTAVFLWMASDKIEAISPKARKIVANTENNLFLSVASAWEIGIKYHLGKLQTTEDPASWIPRALPSMGIKALSITLEHALKAGGLPKHHKDPFDRLLIAQSQGESLPLVTPDKILKKYSIATVW